MTESLCECGAPRCEREGCQDKPTPSGATPECDHDWRLNPVVVATTTTGDAELWTCAKRCGAQVVGPSLSGVSSSRPVVWNDPPTWEKRGV